MRMWMINPKIMCNRHLLGEHVELHMFIGSIKKNINLYGYIKNNLLEEKSIYKRHDELVLEMLNRGMKHNSPLEIIPLFNRGIVNIEDALKELLYRCKDCKMRYLQC